MTTLDENKVVVAGTHFDNVSMAEVVKRICSMVQDRSNPQHICTGNLDHLAMLQHDLEFRAAYENAAMVLADGMPIVWISRMQRHSPDLRERIAGSDLFWYLGEASESNGLRLFLLGGMPDAANQAAEALRIRYPRVKIVGTYCPPKETFMTNEEQERIHEHIRAAAPDVLLVGLGAPKQEKWILANKHKLSVPVSIGVGGSFEMAAGMVRRAPTWAQHVGLEWAFRLMQDPRRLWDRYIGRDLPFLVWLLQQTITNNMVSGASYTGSPSSTTKSISPSS